VKRILGLSVLVLVCSAGVLMALLTPAARPTAPPATLDPASPTARGAFHVHSARSDGTGSLEEIAAAAAARGLQFVVFTDHGDGTREPEPPTYRSGVLCLDGVEISTDGGHYAVVGLPRAPFPLGGQPRDVVEDVKRLGGIGFAAHPGSPKALLQWRDWAAPFDGIEWLNADSEWRDEFVGSLGRVLFTYPFRPVETLAALLDRPATVLDRWREITAKRRVPAIAAADAHARLGFGPAVDPYDDRIVARVPSYRVSFEVFVNHLLLDQPLSGDAVADGSVIVNALKEGRIFSSIDGLARFSAFEASASNGAQTVRIGEYLDPAGPVSLKAQIAAPPGTTLTVLKDGEALYETQENTFKLDVGSDAGVYHFEARLSGADRRTGVPWLLTNPIYVGLRNLHDQLPTTAILRPAAERAPLATAEWRAEASPDSTSVLRQGTLNDGTPALEWHYSLAPGERSNQFAAIRFPMERGRLTQFDRVQVRMAADGPKRIWTQLRSDEPGHRWGRSFYLDSTIRGYDLPLAEFQGMGGDAATTPPLKDIDSVLLVVDTINSRPGSAGVIRILDLWLGR
jgi:hypothetical protein